MEATTEKVAPEEVLRKKFPQKGNLERRIAPLFGDFYRVNYYDPSQENKIVETHFVKVVGEEVVDKTNQTNLN